LHRLRPSVSQLFFVTNVRQGQIGWAIVFGIILAVSIGTVVAAIVVKWRRRQQSPRSDPDTWPWFIRYIPASGVFLVAVAVWVVIWTVILASDLGERLAGLAFAVIFGGFGVRRLWLAKRARSN
jgi:uncharacterized membrane-anchored protein